MSLYDDASLIAYPSGYKESKIYAQKPIDGTGDLTFARASTGTRVNESGLIESVATNVPRIDYTGGGCGSLLLEGQRTNTVLSNSDYTASWSLVNVIPTANATISPNGNNDAQKLTSANTFGQHYIRQVLGGHTVGVPHVFSCFAKAAELDILTLRMVNGGGPTYVNFDLTNGTHDGGTNGKMIDFGNGWYRCISYHASSTSQYLYPYIYTKVGNTQGDGVSGFYVYGAQLEAGSYETSLINTSGTTVTRVADSSSTTGLSSVINSTEGVLYVEGKFPLVTSTTSEINLSVGGSISNAVRIQFRNNGNIRYYLYANGVNMLISNFTSYEDFLKIAVTYKSGEIKVFINGVQEGSTNTLSFAFAGSLDTLKTLNFEGNVQNLMVFPSALTDAELATLTTL